MNTTEFRTSEIFNPSEIISFEEGGIVSKNIIKDRNGNVSLFAFDKGMELSEHSAPFHAMVQILEGKAIILIDKKPYHLQEGQAIIMPASIPHAVKAETRFKMLLTMIK